MPVDWKSDPAIELGGLGSRRIERVDGQRQRTTAEAILNDLRDRPGVVLADEVGMGKTYVALAIAASVISSTRGRSGPVVIMVPSRLRRKAQAHSTRIVRASGLPRLVMRPFRSVSPD